LIRLLSDKPNKTGQAWIAPCAFSTFYPCMAFSIKSGTLLPGGMEIFAPIPESGFGGNSTYEVSAVLFTLLILVLYKRKVEAIASAAANDRMEDMLRREKVC
jgi:hypothetical protein